ncbi:hypothetical protein FPZ24_08875 [Sphingomonas panacisoli]|uniref:Lipoprotein n=1 Tax=Sphingomonas panacisoli TaxID=1813879 RepID=A0A5B8LGX6_9SPHN|nr:hypothetical protein [Sphingomonas panacisoli]QDZ07588.1 hypothetical protein FPZ24_08875 [Sphingomonas panacisoli]
MRISSAGLPALLLAACSQQSADPGAMSNAIDNAQAAAGGDERIECAAAAGSTAFARDCTVERTQSTEGLILTVRRPDNGFHRLLVVTDGRGVIAADGAESAKVTVIGDGRIEVAIGGDRYRLPATVKAKDGK